MPLSAASSSFGDRLRELRKSRGWSLRALAQEIPCSHVHIIGLERGTSAPSPRMAARLDEVLGAGGELERLLSAHRATAPQPVWRTEIDVLQSPAQLLESPHGWAAMLTWAIPDDAITGVARKLADTAPHSSRGSIDPRLIQCVLNAAEGCRRAYHAVPASNLLPAALAHLNLVMSLRPSDLPDRYRAQVIMAAGEMAALVGVLLALDASRYSAALRYLDVAWTAARATDEVELQAVVLGCRSFAISYDGGDHRAGLECADFARQVAACGACPQTRAWVAAVASERCASLGDLAGCQHRLDESQAALVTPNKTEAAWRGIGGYDSSKLRAYEGGNLMRLRRYQDAEPILDDALTQLRAEMTRHRATALLDRAEARLGLGELDAACEDARHALGLVAHVQHTGHLDRIGSLTRRVVQAGCPAARSLRRDLQLIRLDHGLPTETGAA